MSLRLKDNHILPFYKGSLLFDLTVEGYEEGKGLKVTGYITRSRNPYRRFLGLMGYHLSVMRDYFVGDYDHKEYR